MLLWTCVIGSIVVIVLVFVLIYMTVIRKRSDRRLQDAEEMEATAVGLQNGALTETVVHSMFPTTWVHSDFEEELA